MSGKPNTKWMETMVKKFGSREAVSEYMSKGGSKGGKNGVGTLKGFAANPALAARVGKIGGAISKPNKKRIIE